MNEQVADLFRELVRLPHADRMKVLSAASVSPEVRSEVESLLEFDNADDRSLIACIGRAAEWAFEGAGDRLGRRCGPYQLVRPLGSGGMGTVYLAERADGELRQRVAIKMLRLGIAPQSWQVRFLRERQLLASLSHPSIARLVDAGSTEDGQPYLVMEYVEGVPIDEAAANISLRSRLALFANVCDGLAHAHQRLIIHRDLKPSNILVDAGGQPKLLDFGIAKLLDEAGEHTQTVDRLLTPGYASPEQMRGEVQTTATDVYSLGAVLYKLLTGRSPHESDTGASQAFEIVAGTRDISAPRRVNAAIPADVECIVQKALRPRPEDRYASVEALASDIRAYLDGRPVEARAGDRWYRARTFILRHWVPLGATSLVIGSLAVGFVMANRERAIAQRRFQDVRQLSNKLLDLDQRVQQLPGSTTARQAIVDTALEYLRRLSADAKSDPDLTLEMANAYRRVAEVEGVTTGPNLGQSENAERDLEIAGRLVDAVVAAQPTNRPALLTAAQIAHDRMAVAWQGGRSDGTLALARQAAEWMNRYQPRKSDAASAAAILLVLSDIAHQHMIADALEDALRLADQGITLADAFELPSERAGFLDTKALALRYQGQLNGALAAIEESVAINESLPPGPGRDLRLSMSLSRQGWILGGGDTALHLGRTKEAVAVLDRAFVLADQLVHKDANDESARSRLFMAGGTLAEVLLQGDPSRSLAVADHTYRDMAQIDNRLLQIREVDVLATESDALRKLGRRFEARRRLDEAFALLSRLKLYPADTIDAGSEADRALRALADYEADGGNLSRAVALYEDMSDRARKDAARSDSSLVAAAYRSDLLGALAGLRRRQGRDDLASAQVAERLALWHSWERARPDNPFVHAQIARLVP